MSNKSQYKQCCYYCGLPYTSYEHAPPEQLFKGFNCSKIEVPSCDKHNTEKSGSDNAVIKGMLISLDTVSYKYPLQTDTSKAISFAESHFSQVKNKVKNIDKIDGYPQLTHIESSVKIEDWMRELTAALIYNAIRKYDPENAFNKATVFCPGWVKGELTLEPTIIAEVLRSQKLQEERLQHLNWEKGWSSGKINYPEGIYNFELSFDSTDDVVFKHQFFNSILWYVGIKTSKETREKIISKIRLNDSSQ